MSLDLVSALDRALQAAAGQPNQGNHPSQIHRNRSRNFVEALGNEFRAYYEEDRM